MRRRARNETRVSSDPSNPDPPELVRLDAVGMHTLGEMVVGVPVPPGWFFRLRPADGTPREVAEAIRRDLLARGAAGVAVEMPEEKETVPGQEREVGTSTHLSAVEVLARVVESANTADRGALRARVAESAGRFRI